MGSVLDFGVVAERRPDLLWGCLGTFGLAIASLLLAMVIGIQGDDASWGFVTSKGEQDGFDADVGRLFGQFVGVPVEFFPTAVANRTSALVMGRVDILFATMGRYPDRAKAIQLSKPYAANDVVLVASVSMTVKTPEDMANHTIGVARSSAQDTAVTKAAPASATIRRFDDDAATIQALLSGQVEMAGANQFYPGRLNQSRPGMFERTPDFLAGGVLGTVNVSDKIVSPWNWELNTGENPAYTRTRRKPVTRSAARLAHYRSRTSISGRIQPSRAGGSRSSTNVSTSSRGIHSVFRSATFATSYVARRLRSSLAGRVCRRFG